jgi:hypothetical protein
VRKVLNPIAIPMVQERLLITTRMIARKTQAAPVVGVEAALVVRVVLMIPLTKAASLRLMKNLRTAMLKTERKPRTVR